MKKQNNPITIWFITVFQKVQKTLFVGPDFGASRTWGFYQSRDIALQAVRENWTDMHEGYYDYAVVEGYDEGISRAHDPAKAQWFRWNECEQAYVEIEQPEAVKRCGSWALG